MQQQQFLNERAPLANYVNGRPEINQQQTENANAMAKKVADKMTHSASNLPVSRNVSSSTYSAVNDGLIAMSLLQGMTVQSTGQLETATSNPLADRQLIAVNKLDDNGSQVRSQVGLFKLSETATAVQSYAISKTKNSLEKNFLNCNQLGNERAIGEQSAIERAELVDHPERVPSSEGTSSDRTRRALSGSQFGERAERCEEASREKQESAETRQGSRSAVEEAKGNKSQDLKDCLIDGEQEQKQSNERLDPWSDLVNGDCSRPAASGVASVRLANSVALGDRPVSEVGSIVNGKAKRGSPASGPTTGLTGLGESETVEGESVKEKLNCSGEKEELASGSLLNGEPGAIRAAKKRKINHSTYGKAGEEEHSSTHSNEPKMRPHPAMSRTLADQSASVQQRSDQVEYNLLTNNDLLNAARNIGNLADLNALASMGNLAGINGPIDDLPATLQNGLQGSDLASKLGRASCQLTMASNQTASRLESKQPLDGRHANAPNANDSQAKPEHGSDRAASCNNPNNCAQQEPTPAMAGTVNHQVASNDHPVAMRKPNSAKRSRLSHSPSAQSSPLSSPSNCVNSEVDCRLNSSFKTNLSSLPNASTLSSLSNLSSNLLFNEADQSGEPLVL